MTVTNELRQIHPRRDDHGRPVIINCPTQPSPTATWHDPKAVAVFVPDGPEPPTLNGIPLTVAQPRKDAEDWQRLVSPSSRVKTPPFPKTSLKPAAGCVIVEPDGRVWLVEPTNQWAGYERTFPKGTREASYSFEAAAAKEVFEETGLLVEVGAYLLDCRRGNSMTRFFLARRIGGSPSAMGWESQAVCLVPLAQLKRFAPHKYDERVVEAVLARDRWELGC